jgi:hypothetical protein
MRPSAAGGAGAELDAELDAELAQMATAEPPPSLSRRSRVPRTTSEVLKEQRQHTHKGAHPYRVILGEVRRKLMNTRRRMEEMLETGQDLPAGDEDEWWVGPLGQGGVPFLASHVEFDPGWTQEGTGYA